LGQRELVYEVVDRCSSQDDQVQTSEKIVETWREGQHLGCYNQAAWLGRKHPAGKAVVEIVEAPYHTEEGIDPAFRRGRSIVGCTTFGY